MVDVGGAEVEGGEDGDSKFWLMVHDGVVQPVVAGMYELLFGYVCRHPYPPPPLIRPIFDWSEVGETIPQAAPLLDSTLLTQFLSRRVQDITPSSDEQVAATFSSSSLPLFLSLFVSLLSYLLPPSSLSPFPSLSSLPSSLSYSPSFLSSLSSLPGSGARILYKGSYCRGEHDSDRRGGRTGEAIHLD